MHRPAPIRLASPDAGKSARTGPRALLRQRRRLLLIAVAILVVVFVAASDALHGLVTRAVEAAEGVIVGRPVFGMLVFVGLAALSAMLMFVSSALLVPVGVHVWGETGCFLLLWSGWFLGGIVSYGIGRYLGRQVAGVFASDEKRAYYEERIAAHATFPVILLFQLALPSEIPGYVLGTLRYRFAGYLAALALAELPYALGTVFLGAGFLRRQYLLMIGLGVGGLVLVAWAFRRLHRKLSA